MRVLFTLVASALVFGTSGKAHCQSGMLGNIEEDRQFLIDATTDFAIQFAMLDRAMSIIVGECQLEGQGGISFEEMHVVHAFDLNQQLDRFEHSMTSYVPKLDVPSTMSRRILKHGVRELHASGGGPVGMVTEVSSLPERERDAFKYPRLFAYNLPIEFAYNLRKGSIGGDSVNHVFPPEKLFHVRREGGCVVGRYWHGRRRKLGYNEIWVDMATSLIVKRKYYLMRYGLPPDAKLDKNNCEQLTLITEANETKWREASGKTLPSDVSIRVYRPFKANYRFRISWEFGDQVLEQVFDDEDFSNAPLGQSIVNEYVERAVEGYYKK